MGGSVSPVGRRRAWLAWLLGSIRRLKMSWSTLAYIGFMVAAIFITMVAMHLAGLTSATGANGKMALEMTVAALITYVVFAIGLFRELFKDSSVQKSIAELRADLDRVSSKVDRVASDVSELKTDVSELKTKINDMQASNEARFKAIEDRLDAAGL